MSKFNRTNYFTVKDKIKFKEEMEKIPNAQVIESMDQFSIQYDSKIRKFPDFEDIESENEFISLLQKIAKHLIDDEVAILKEVGFYKNMHIFGTAMAINNKEELVSISLKDIYQHAKELGGKNREISEVAF